MGYTTGFVTGGGGVGVGLGFGVGVDVGVGLDVGVGVGLVVGVGRSGVGDGVATATTGVRLRNGTTPALTEYNNPEATVVNNKATPSQIRGDFQPGNGRPPPALAGRCSGFTGVLLPGG